MKHKNCHLKPKGYFHQGTEYTIKRRSIGSLCTDILSCHASFVARKWNPPDTLSVWEIIFQKTVFQIPSRTTVWRYGWECIRLCSWYSSANRLHPRHRDHTWAVLVRFHRRFSTNFAGWARWSPARIQHWTTTNWQGPWFNVRREVAKKQGRSAQPHNNHVADATFRRARKGSGAREWRSGYIVCSPRTPGVVSEAGFLDIVLILAPISWKVLTVMSFVSVRRERDVANPTMKAVMLYVASLQRIWPEKCKKMLTTRKAFICSCTRETNLHLITNLQKNNLSSNQYTHKSFSKTTPKPNVAGC